MFAIGGVYLGCPSSKCLSMVYLCLHKIRDPSQCEGLHTGHPTSPHPHILSYPTCTLTPAMVSYLNFSKCDVSHYYPFISLFTLLEMSQTLISFTLYPNLNHTYPLRYAQVYFMFQFTGSF